MRNWLNSLCAAYDLFRLAVVDRVLAVAIRQAADISRRDDEHRVDFHPLFCFRLVALVANDHPLAQKDYLDAEDFQNETLITYPVEDDALDVVRLLLRPQGITPARRTADLTVAH
ncbi:LysR substrate-binding domain-containing protein [Paraburkholderia sp. J11-2]|uniref:LysR substrate-binding domain-containing protein n=1 Tax=Paraburkholderia sp. J11-2 TaxID=2805431 RepID=UPI0039EFA564